MNTVAPRANTSFNTPSALLRRVLLADAVGTGISGLALLVAAAPLSARLGLPSGLLMGAAAIFIPFAAYVGWLGTRRRVHRPLVFAAIVLNALWAVDSVLLLLTPWVQPTPFGELFVIAQAVLVAGIAELEFIGLRRSTLVESYARL
jgi:hypothetical protein